MRHRILLGCLVFSGFTGLAYELLWVRLLALGFGSTTLSFSTVLAVFFGGLGLGTWLAGRRAARLTNPMRAYAYLEFGTGALALALYPVLANLGAVFARIDPGPGLTGGLVRAAVSVPILLGPTLLMGATLPFVARAVVADDDEVGRGTGLIYAFNTFGAFLGAYGVTYWLLPELGVFTSTLVAVGVNFAVGGVAWVASSGAHVAPAPEAEQALDEDEVEAKHRRVATAIAFLVGFAAICFQVVWARLMSIFLDGTVYGVGAVLICVLLGIGLGSLVIAPGLRRAKDAGLWLTGLQCVILVSVVLITSNIEVVAYLTRTVAEAQPGLPGLHAQLGVVLAVLIVPSVASGASFPLLVQIIETKAARAPRTFASLYTSNTVGSILGSLLTGFVLIPETGTVATLFLGVIVLGLVGAMAMLIFGASARPVRLVAMALPLVLVASFTGYDARRISQAGRRSAVKRSYAAFLADLDKTASSVKFFSEGAAATVSVKVESKMTSLILNGLGQGGRAHRPPHHVFESLMVAYVPLAYAEAPQRGLLVGLGAGVTADALLQLGLPDLTVVELEADVVTGLSYIFPEGASPLQDPQLKLAIGDARHHLLVSAIEAPHGYDLIASMPAHPWVASSIFTREFFEIAKDNLSPQGVFSTWFGLERVDAEVVRSLLRAFQDVFPHAAVHWLPEAGALYLVGSPAPLTIDLARLERLTGAPIVQAREAVADPYFLPERLLTVATPDRRLVGEGPVNTDDSAFVEVQTPRTSTAVPDPERLFGAVALPLSAIQPEARRPEILLELMERHLGTPGGRVPLIRHRRAGVDRLRRTLEAVGPGLDEATRTYLQGRVALVANDPRRARAALSAVPASAAVYDRAQAFLPLTAPQGSPARDAAFAALPPDGRAWALWLDQPVSTASVAIRAALAADAAALDARAEGDRTLALVLELVRPAETRRFDPDRFASYAEVLRKGNNLALVEGAHAYAVDRGWDRLVPALPARVMALRKNRARTLARQGRAAGARGDFARSAAILGRALARHPLDNQNQRLWLVATVHAGGDLAAARRRLRLLGWTDAAIDFEVRRVQRR